MSKGVKMNKKFIALGIVMLIVTAMLTSWGIWDWDFWWHLKTGEWILKHRAVPSSDPFAFTSVPPPTERETTILRGYWLSQVIVYVFWKIFGFAGVVILRMAVFMSLLVIFLFWFKKKGLDLVAVFILSSLYILNATLFTGDRPQIWSFFFIPLLFILIEELRKDKKNALYGFLIPAIMTIWSNMHGGYIAGVCMLAFYIISSFFIRGYTWKFRGVMVLGILFSFFNPNGYHQFLVTLRGVRESYQHGIIENLSVVQSMSRFGLVNVPYLIILVILTILLVSRFREVRKEHLLLVLIGLPVSLIAYRLTAVFTLLMIPLAAGYLEDGVRRSVKTMFAGILALLLVFSLYLNRSGIFDFSVSLREYPDGAVRFIKNIGLGSARTFGNYEWGGYLIWEDVPVFVDGRTLRKEVLTSYYHVMFQGKIEGLDYWGVKMILFSGSDLTTGRPFSLLDRVVEEKDRWVLIYGDQKSLVFLKREDEFRDIIKQYAIPSVFAYNLVQIRAKEILSSRPEDPLALASFAYASYKKGMPGTGLPYIQKALRMGESDPFVRRVAELYRERF